MRDDYRQPNPNTSIAVTAKWAGKSDAPSALEDLTYWWQRVGTEAHELEEGLLRFEVYQVAGEDALIIHEVFEDNAELKFHLSKGTAEKYKKDIDEVATPEAYFFRGPVSWTIRTYSKFLHLPATYSSQGSSYTSDGGNMSDGSILSGHQKPEK
ncbi:MAG: antibiotic biosynthesis monooxygenase [Actinomycetia bacterium]|nr:antibiotic biosynthesis monooxygenase [Actinomycetes bacterium]